MQGGALRSSVTRCQRPTSSARQLAVVVAHPPHAALRAAWGPRAGLPPCSERPASNRQKRCRPGGLRYEACNNVAGEGWAPPAASTLRSIDTGGCKSAAGQVAGERSLLPATPSLLQLLLDVGAQLHGVVDLVVELLVFLRGAVQVLVDVLDRGLLHAELVLALGE